MSDSNITKRALAAALKQLMDEEPFAKISVGEICERCQLNRKSFYYHFQDKYDLVNWIFDTEFIAAANQRDYHHNWEVFHDLADYFYANRSFYRKALQIKGQNSFQDHFRELMFPFLSAIIEPQISDHASGDDPGLLEFQIHFCSDALIATLERWLLDREPAPPEIFLRRLRSCLQMISDSVSDDLFFQEKSS
ncbi:MAG: dihydroxyacetone kinase transcriptional activator DhaS [Clostridiales bacterium]|nr:dihydroxyacetone kinase transcriptional activator DhaS [Clostridiales bacterium]